MFRLFYLLSLVKQAPYLTQGMHCDPEKHCLKFIVNYVYKLFEQRIKENWNRKIETVDLELENWN